MNFASKRYKRTALSQVIIRLDFHEFIDNNKLYCDEVENAILPSFPRKGMQQLIKFQTMNVTFNPIGSKTENTTIDGIQQEFSNTFGNKLILSNKFLIMEINQYSSYENALSAFTPVLKAVFAQSLPTVIRTGVRYINIYNDDSIKPQKNYFTSPVSALMDAKLTSDGKCIRALNLTEYVIDDMRLNFRYGQFNPQYPQVMKKPHFVLDYDCFSESSIQGYEGIMEHVNKGHDEIQKLFEASITETLKKVMGPWTNI